MSIGRFRGRRRALGQRPDLLARWQEAGARRIEAAHPSGLDLSRMSVGRGGARLCTSHGDHYANGGELGCALSSGHCHASTACAGAIILHRPCSRRFQTGLGPLSSCRLCPNRRLRQLTLGFVLIPHAAHPTPEVFQRDLSQRINPGRRFV